MALKEGATLADIINEVAYERTKPLVRLHNRTKNIHEEQINQFLSLLHGKEIKVLELGFGIGRDIKKLSKDHRINYLGIDTSSEMLVVAKKNNRKANLKIQDLHHLSLPLKSIDGIWAAAIFHHMITPDDLNEGLFESHRVLKDNGVIFISVREGDGLWEAPNGIVYYRHRLNSFSKILKSAGFEIIKCRRETSRPNQNYLEFFAKKSTGQHIL